MISIYRVFPFYKELKQKLPTWLEVDKTITGYYEVYKPGKLIAEAILVRKNELIIYTIGKALTGQKIKLKI